MTEKLVREMTILGVDDQEDGVILLEQVLRKAGYGKVITTTDSREVVRLCEEISPDLLILDLHMPQPSGYEILDELALRKGEANSFPILVLTADITPAAKVKALAMGAKDFLTKPWEQVDLLLQVRNLLETQLLYRKLRESRHTASAQIAEFSAAGGAAEALHRLALALECFDAELGNRATRVSRTASRLADEMGCGPEAAAQIRVAARIYDIGMLAVPSDVRHKFDGLSAGERNILRKHAAAAEHILSDASGSVELSRQIAVSHHERWDGGGYPAGISGEAIPLAARIVAVAERLDHLTHPSSDSSGLTNQEALVEIRRQSGFAFDPEVVTALARSLDPAPASVR